MDKTNTCPESTGKILRFMEEIHLMHLSMKLVPRSTLSGKLSINLNQVWTLRSLICLINERALSIIIDIFVAIQKFWFLGA